jgi:Ca2+/Na+ antiporter
VTALIHARILIGIVSLAFLVATFEFIRKRRLREEYAILWLLTALAIAVLSLWPGLVEVLSRITGFYYISSVVAILFVFVVGLMMHYSIVVSKMKEDNKELAQKHALLEQKVRAMERRTANPQDE